MAKVRRIDKKVPQTWEEALSSFILFKQAQGLSQTTIKDYQKHISMFFKRHPQAYNSEKLKACVLEYMNQKVAPATYNLRRAYLKNFFTWCMVEAIFAENPLAGIQKKRDEGRVRNVDEDVLRRLLKLPNQKTFAGLRDYTLILVALDTGIRPGEALQLLVHDVDIAAFTITVRRDIAKTRRTRVLPISMWSAKALKKLIQARHKEWSNDVPVFCSHDGASYRTDSWIKRLDMYSEKLGVKIRPYDLRHTFSLMFLRQGGHAHALQHMLGHTNMEMTRRYVNLTNDDLAEQHRLASPIQNLVQKRNRKGKLD